MGYPISRKTPFYALVHRCLMFSCIMTSAIAQTAGPTLSMATVTIRVVDEFGMPFDVALESFASVDGGEMVRRFKDLRGDHIPYGAYLYTLKRSGGYRQDVIRGSASIGSPEVFLIVPVSRFFVPGAASDRAIPPGFVIRGNIHPVPSSSTAVPLRIRLTAIDKNEQLDVGVDPAGHFRIYVPLIGRYVLTLIRDDNVLAEEIVSFDKGTGKEFSVQLSERPPVVLHVP